MIVLGGEPGRVAPVGVRGALAGLRAMNGVWCAGANRVDIPMESGRLAGEDARRAGAGLDYLD